MTRPLTDGKVIFSFDCARRSLGVAVMRIGRPEIPRSPITAEWYGLDIATKISVVELWMAEITSAISRMVEILEIRVADLGEATAHAWDSAPPLKQLLGDIRRQWGAPEIVIYEFQMVQNDKSRMISNMIVYEFCDSRIICTPPALKTTLSMMPFDGWLTHCPRMQKKIKGGKTLATHWHNRVDGRMVVQDCLAICSKSYDANKLFSSVLVEWICSVWKYSLDKLDRAVFDDAGDAVAQVFAALRAGKF